MTGDLVGGWRRHGRRAKACGGIPRVAVSQSVPRPDGTVIDTLDVLSARARAVARSLLDGPDRTDPPPLPSSFAQPYAQALQALARRSASSPTCARPGSS